MFSRIALNCIIIKKKVGMKNQIEKALDAIRSAKRGQECREEWLFIQEHMENDKTGIAAAVSAGIAIDPRYVLQQVSIPKGKRGGLGRYSGKNVLIFTTTVTRRGGQIEYYILEA